ncbi:MAG: O-antigen ligase family protein [Oscillospiraceae bacterium]|nr:O-antigen ligase family protein [Oscillospiraceae bacterium]
MEVRKENKVLMLLVFALSTAMFYLSEEVIPLGSFNLMTKYALALGILFLCVFGFLARPNVGMLGQLGKDALTLSVPALLTLLVSMVLWVFHRVSSDVISTGLSDVLYQLLSLMLSLCVVLVFGRKAVGLQFGAMIAANLLILINRHILVHGIGVFLKDLWTLVRSFGMVSGGTMVAVEVNDLTFAIGLYLLYYLIKNRPVPHRGWYLLAACFFFAVGLKRIALAGIAVALVVVLLCRFFKEDSRKRLLQFLSLGLIGFALLYILAIKTGVYEYLAQRYNIDTMGRITLIHLIDEYYSFSPLFKGFGLGYTVEWLASEEIQKLTQIRRLHNIFLELYVELGFWGYLVWLFSNFFFRVRHFCRKRGAQCALMTFSALLYCYFTYLTDNTYSYFYLNTALFTVILSCAAEFIDQETIREAEL